MLRIIALALCCTALLAGVRPAQASYDWCSVDPTLLFSRGGLISSLLRNGVADVQMLVPLSAIPLDGKARLNVRVPSNVRGTEVLNTSLPLLFTLQTSFAPNKPATDGSPYEVDLDLLVPAGKQAFPVRLLVTNLTTGEISITEGVAGQKLYKTITIVE
jgi:hypothetical protein